MLRGHRRATMPWRRSTGLACLFVLAAAASASAAEPAPQSCDEAYPTSGPGGLDLALFCTVDRIRATIQDAAAGGPALPPLAISLVLGGLLVVVVVWRLVASRAGRPVPAAPAPPNWWACASCRSLNPPEAERCYGCGIGRPGDAAIAPTADTALMDQRFGRPED
jgi:hypothetical protein